MKTKNFLNLKSWLLMMLMLIGAGGNLWAEDVTVTFASNVDVGTGTSASGSNSISKDGITISCTNGGFAISGGAHYRLGANSTTTISSSVGNIKSVVITGPMGTGNNSISKFNSSTGWSISSSKGTATWNGDAVSVSIKASAQVRPTKFEVTYTPSGNAPIVDTPTFSPAEGAVAGGTEVTISCTTDGATIYYTTDGSTPSTNSYSGSSVIINESQTIKAYAVKNGYADSEIATATYTVKQTISGYAIDFENDVEYTDWIFNNVGRSTGDISAHGGSYYGSNINDAGNGVSTAFLQTKNKIVNPGTFTCYFSKTTNNTTASSWVLQVSRDGNTWTDVKSQSAVSMTKGEWIEFTKDLSSYSDVYVRLYYDGTNAERAVDDISLTLKNTSLQDVILQFPEASYNATMGAEFNAPTASAEPTVTGIEYSSSNTSVATVDANTGAVTLVAAGTTTITATFAGDEEYNGASASYTLNVARDPNGPGTQNNPYTVAQALENTPSSGNSDNVYIKGIVSKFYKDDIISDGSNYRYYISDDGSTNSQLLVYKGKKSSTEEFSDAEDLQIGDVVVIYGQLTTYNNTQEINSGNYIVSLTRPVYEITAKSNNEALGTVSLDGNIITATLKDGSRYADPAFTVDAEGEVTVEQDGNEFVVVAKSNCTVTINFEAIPTHKVTWSINGETSEETVAEGAALSHETPADIDGKTFVGWVIAPIEGELENAPASLITNPVMGTADVTYYAVFASQEGSGDPTWTETALSALTASDTFVIVGNVYAMPHNNGTSSAPTATEITVDGNKLTSSVSDNIKWNVSGNATDGYTFYPNGDDKKWLYCNTEAASGSNNNMRVGTGDRKVFELDTNGYLVTKDTYTTRYLSLYNSQDFRGYVTTSNGAFVPAFYKYSSNISYSGYCTTVDVPIRISTVEELKAFRDAVNGGNQFAGKTVKLAADLDLSGEENWTPIGNLVAYPTQSFDGVFDGNGHTIKNVTVVDQTPKHAVAGLFGSVVNGTIKNLTVENVNLTSSHYAGGIVAYTSNAPTIENCHVIGGTITSIPELIDGSYDNGDKVGGIMGYATAGSTINNCTVEGLTIKAHRDLGGIVGFSAGNVTNNTVKNTTIIQSYENNGYKDAVDTYDYIVGRNGGATLDNNVYEGQNNVLTVEGAVAKIGEKYYGKLQAAFNAAESGSTVTLLKDYDAKNEAMAGGTRQFVINKSITFDGGGFTLTTKNRGIGIGNVNGDVAENIDVTIKNVTVLNTASGARCIDTRGKIGSLTLEGVTLNTQGAPSGYTQPLTIGGNQSDVANVTITNSTIQTNDNATAYYAIITFNPVNMTVTNSTIKGWANIYAKKADGSCAGSAGSVFNFDKCTLKSSNAYSNTSNAFSAFTIEDNNVTINVTNSDIVITNTGDQLQSIAGYPKDNTLSGNKVTLGEGNKVKFVEPGQFAFVINQSEGSEFTVTGGLFSTVVPDEYCAEGLTTVANTDEATKDEYPYAVGVKVELAQPIIFHDGGEYEDELTVAIAGEGVKYTLNGGAEQTYSAPFTISETTTVKAWAEKDGVKSDEVEKTFTIVAKQAGAEVADGYYNIKTNDGKFVNVAGRKTVTLVSDTEGKAGTVIRVNADAEGVKVLRSQGVDLPGYAKKAMNYVPEIVQLAVDKLHAEGAGELLGETGLEKIMDKFNESFDYNLYLEKDGEAYRIYGRTPSMKPVVDFYAENKANVDAKLPELEEFINKAIQKVLQKTNGSGASVLVPFSLQTIWERMDSTLTNPADDEAKFYEEVLSSEANVWNFAYQTAMLYWGNLKNHPRFAEIQGKLGDYSKYIDKVENIRPNFRYYIVPSASGVDFISQGNVAITDASTAWTMEPVSEFKANFDVELNHTVYSTNGGVQDEYKEYYTTLYTDFAYTLPEGVKAYKVTEITEKYGVAKREEITGVIPAQTPVLLVTSNKGAQTLTLTTEAGTAVTGNLLVGADELINQYQLKTSQVESLFNLAKDVIGESAYNEYLKKYEHLMLTNAGTVNNKYFFGLSAEDVEKCVVKNENNEEDCVIRSLSTGDEKIGFYNNWTAGANQAFLISSLNPVKLWLVGDVNRDGSISIADVTALVNIILGKAIYPEDADEYDFEAANVNGDNIISISDVTKLVNIILGKE